MVCRTHTDTPARRRCYLCKHPVCPACQKKAYHHIFCGDRCIEAFWKNEKPSTDLAVQLQQLDSSLNEDFHEVGEIVSEDIRGEVHRLEEALDQALTALSTMIEGSAVAASKELEAAQLELTRLTKEVDRNQENRSTRIQDVQAEVNQLAKTIRALTVELKDQVEEKFNKLIGDAELIQHRIAYVEKLVEEKSKRHLDAQEQKSEEIIQKVEEARKGVHDSLESSSISLKKVIESSEQSLRENVEEFETNVKGEFGSVRQLYANESELQDKRTEAILNSNTVHLKELIDRIEKSQEATHRHTTEKAQSVETSIALLEKKVERLSGEVSSTSKTQIDEMDEIAKRLSTVENHVQQTLSDVTLSVQHKLDETAIQLKSKIEESLKGIVDDMAMIAAGQNKNWHDFIRLAQQSAGEAVTKLRPEISKKLNSEVEVLAKSQAKEIEKLSETLHSQVKKKLNRWNSWQGKFASSIMAVLLGLWGGYWVLSALHTEKDWSKEIDQKLATHDQSIRTWVSDANLARHEVAKVEVDPSANLIPVSAMTRGSTDRKEVSFTFDADEHANAAGPILDALKARGLHATIFLTGRFIEANPEIVKRIVADGHEVGNHLREHVHLIDYKTRKTLVGRQDLVNLLLGTEKVFKEVTGKEMLKFWRAPYGELNNEHIQWAATLGYRHIGWTRSGKRSLDTLDWVETPKNSLYRTSEQIQKQIFDFETSDPFHLNGGVVLMHLGTLRTKDYPYEKLPIILDELKRRGYEIVPVSKVLRTDLAMK